MSIATKSAAAMFAVLAFGAVVSLASNQALANTKGSSGSGGGPPHRPYQPTPGQKTYYNPLDRARSAQKCYWLPTVSNGTVTGLHSVCNWVKK